MGEPSAFALLARLLPSLVLIVGGLLLVRRWAQRGGAGTRAGVRVITRTPLARGAMIAVVEYDGRRFLVGAGERGVHLLSELGTPDLVADQEASAPAPPDRPRTGLLDRLRGMTIRTHLERPSFVPPHT